MRKKTVLFLLVLAGSIFSRMQAQEVIMTLEAEKAELTAPVKIKYVSGYSGNAYVGDNDPGSVITFRNVNIENEGTYEFRTYYTSMHIRSVAVKSGIYPKVIVTTPQTTLDWNTPPVAVMVTYIYLNKGANTIAITPYNGGGPNIDKFEICKTAVSMTRPDPVKVTFDYDLTDDAAISSNKTTENLSHITDNEEYTVYSYSGSSAEIKIECNMPYLLTGYLLSSGANDSKNAKTWKLEYSADGNTYSAVTPSKTEDLENGAFFHINRLPHQGNAAKYYRVTAYGGSIGEIQLFGIPYLANTDNKNFPEDITKGVDYRNKVLGEPLGVYVYGSFDERCYNLFDRDMSKKYYSGDVANFSVQIELSIPAALDYYTMTSCQDYVERDPKTWVVEGFDKNWETVSEIRNFLFPTRYATMKFYCEPTKKYRGYRLRTLDNNGADRFQLLKWQLFEKTGIFPVAQTSYSGPSTIYSVYSAGQEIIMKTEESGYYQICNLAGQPVNTGRLDAPEYRVPANKGIYIVKIVTGKETRTQKVVVK